MEWVADVSGDHVGLEPMKPLPSRILDASVRNVGPLIPVPERPGVVEQYLIVRVVRQDKAPEPWKWPEWLKCNYIAMDEDGMWWGYNEIPSFEDGVWFSTGDFRYETPLNDKTVAFTPPPVDPDDAESSLRANPAIR